MKSEHDRICAEVCEAFVAANVQPTARMVRDVWVKRYGTAPSFTVMLPVMRKWLTKRRNSRRVRALVRAYSRLDPVERESVMRFLSQLHPRETDGNHARAG